MDKIRSRSSNLHAHDNNYLCDLDRMVEMEIETLDGVNLILPRANDKPEAEHLTPAEIRFLDRAADWLSARPDPAALLQQLSERVLGGGDVPEDVDATDVAPSDHQPDQEEYQDKADDTPPTENAGD